MDFNLMQLTPADIPQALREGLDPEATTPSGLSLLRRCSEHPHIVEALLKAGADPNRHSALSRYTVLHETENPQTVELLASYGADLDAQSATGCTALHMACGADRNAPVNHEKIDALLASGARVDATDNRGNTPLHLARSARAVDMLVEAGADLDTRNNDGFVPGQTLDHGLDAHAEEAIARIHWHEDARRAEQQRQSFESSTAAVPEKYRTDDWAPSPEAEEQGITLIREGLQVDRVESSQPIRSRSMRL